LVENTAQGAGMLAEHGLAYWIESDDGHRVLFDTGQGNVLAGNAYRLNIPLHDAEAIVLSHGHFDHTGGLDEMLCNGPPAPIYAHPAAFDAKYARNRDGTAREIGIPLAVRESLHRHAPKVIGTESPTTILGALTATGQVARTTDFEDTGGPFFLDAACSKRDPLIDDQSLFFETSEGIVVLLGCAHSGVINTLRYIGELSGNKPIRAVIGGMHLVSASPARITRTIEEFRRLDVRSLAPCHCTGMAATVALWNALSGRCVACHVGTRFEFEECRASPVSRSSLGSDRTGAAIGDSPNSESTRR
jgi:7,8-dihydropterin-6-yl-methyl-4-(beta-D-ribofuranosyl)aminobenzene 5'-phosphate synthase